MSSLVVLEDDDDLRETLALALETTLDSQVLAAGAVSDVMRLGSKALASNCSLIDVNLGPGKPTGLDAWSWLRGAGYRGRIIFLTGHAASFPQLQETCREPNTLLLEKPVPMTRLLPLIQEACR